MDVDWQIGRYIGSIYYGDNEKKSRWRKDVVKKDEGSATLPPAPSFSVGPQNNQAAQHAFRGLHGGKSEFNLLTGASDEAYNSVLGGNAHYYQELICCNDDFSMYEACFYFWFSSCL